jgi:hypothetical protein
MAASGILQISSNFPVICRSAYVASPGYGDLLAADSVGKRSICE